MLLIKLLSGKFLLSRKPRPNTLNANVKCVCWEHGAVWGFMLQLSFQQTRADLAAPAVAPAAEHYPNSAYTIQGDRSC